MLLKKPVVPVRLLPSQVVALNKLALKGEDTTVSSLIRDAVGEFIKRRQPNTFEGEFKR